MGARRKMGRCVAQRAQARETCPEGSMAMISPARSTPPASLGAPTRARAPTTGKRKVEYSAANTRRGACRTTVRKRASRRDRCRSAHRPTAAAATSLASASVRIGPSPYHMPAARTTSTPATVRGSDRARSHTVRPAVRKRSCRRSSIGFYGALCHPAEHPCASNFLRATHRASSAAQSTKACQLI